MKPKRIFPAIDAYLIFSFINATGIVTKIKKNKEKRSKENKVNFLARSILLEALIL